MSACIGAARLACATAMLALAGCVPADGDLRQWMAAQREQIVPEPTPVEAPTRYRPLAYAHQALADPFSYERLTQALQRDRPVRPGAALMASESNRRREPLEAHPLDAMTLVGTLERGGQRVALVRVDGLLHQVRTGNYLGQNYGRVTRITEQEVSLREIVQDAASEWIERKAALQLQESSR